MGSKLAGVIGAMVAVPTAVLVTVLIQEYLVQRDEADSAGTHPRAHRMRRKHAPAAVVTTCYHEVSSILRSMLKIQIHPAEPHTRTAL